MTPRRIVLLCLLLAGLCALPCAGIKSFAVTRDDGQTFQEQFPVDYNVVVPCTDDIVRLSGTLHVIYTVHEDNGGGYHVSSHANWQGVEGVSETTGERYHFISAGHGSFNTSGDFPFTSTTTTSGVVVGQGDGALSAVHNVFHITVNANGELTSLFAHQYGECK